MYSIETLKTILMVVYLVHSLVEMYLHLSEPFKGLWYEYTFGYPAAILGIIIILGALINQEPVSAVMWVFITYLGYNRYLKAKKEVEK